MSGLAPGGGNVAFLGRHRGASTVTMAPPDPSGNSRPTGVGVSANVSASNGLMFEGRLSLGLLSALVVSLIAFYLWTRSAQG
jgi:hypothetical protein